MHSKPDSSLEFSANKSRLARALSIDWLGQTTASICWIFSMLIYGIGSAGDWLQLIAASAWLLANLFVIVKPQTE